MNTAADTLESLMTSWGGETLVLRRDKPTGAWLIVALYSTRANGSGGGTRMRVYPDLSAAVRDAQRLAEGMAAKFAICRMAFGGGKAVIALPSGFAEHERPALLRRYGELVQSLSGRFVTAPDVGTSPADMDIIAETGAPYILARTEATGGVGDSSGPTAVGVLAGIQATCAVVFGDASLSGRRILVQGAGSVGGRLLELLAEAGAEPLFSDVNPEAIARYRDQAGYTFVDPNAIYDADCDIFAPCALGAVLNAATIPHLRCQAVAGAANNQLATPDDANRLRERGILYAPDYVINLGGAMGLVGLERLGWTRAEANQHVATAVAEALGEVYALADREHSNTFAAAQRIVEQRLHEETPAP